MTVLIAVLPVFPVPNHLFVADSKDLLTPFLFETCKLKAHFTIMLKFGHILDHTIGDVLTTSVN